MNKTANTSAKKFLEILSETQARPAGVGPSVLQPTPARARARDGARKALDAGADAGLRWMAEGALRAERRVDDLLTAAARGKTFSASELIAWQALVFRYSQTVEVISHATDRLIGSIKQTLGTQV